MTLHHVLTRMFLRNLTSTAAGRAHLLNQIADAEDNGEAQIFDQAMARVDDPKLAKIIERHRSDEIRHGELFRAARDRTGIDPGAVPNDLRIMESINDKLGGFFDRELSSSDDVVEAYLVLQVIEERAVTQFSIFEESFRSIDPETARVFREVAEDEARHLKYCQAVARHYGKDAKTVAARLDVLRRIEAEAFQQTSSANVEYCLERDLIRGTTARLFWRGVQWLGRTLEVRPMTPFASMATA